MLIELRVESITRQNSGKWMNCTKFLNGEGLSALETTTSKLRVIKHITPRGRNIRAISTFSRFKEIKTSENNFLCLKNWNKDFNSKCMWDHYCPWVIFFFSLDHHSWQVNFSIDKIPSGDRKQNWTLLYKEEFLPREITSLRWNIMGSMWEVRRKRY